MRAEDLLAAVFPEQMVCRDNHNGPIEFPDHPLVNETIGDCLHEAMDLDGIRMLAAMRVAQIEYTGGRYPAPSPMAHEILNANPYAFLDDAPLEERRARAVSLRRTDLRLEREFGQLDQAAIDEIRVRHGPKSAMATSSMTFCLGLEIYRWESALRGGALLKN